ncbi:MAG: hypothetical protein LBP32_00460 [Spirochaetaceae bacterium]|jgi:hypothetical protein|nr:hypothetical protein [Spirochaetaceae bacterium]
MQYFTFPNGITAYGVFSCGVIEGTRNAKAGLGTPRLSGDVQRAEVPPMTEGKQHPGAYSLGLYGFIISE